MFSLGFRDLGLKVFSPEDLGGFAICKCLGAGCDEESGVRGARVLAEFRLDTFGCEARTNKSTRNCCRYPAASTLKFLRLAMLGQCGITLNPKPKTKTQFLFSLRFLARRVKRGGTFTIPKTLGLNH